jgi:CRISPR-associated protein Cas2
VPVQYSLYYFEGSRHAVQELFKDIEARIKPEADDVRAYPLRATPDIVILGRGNLPLTLRLLSALQPALIELLQGQTG